MRFRRQKWALLLSLATVITLGTLPLLAQVPKGDQAGDSKKAVPAATSYDPSRRVPSYFGQVGLSGDQRESIYKLRAKHLKTIAELKKQLVDANAAMIAECETVLTDSQKQLLESRRRTASEKRKAGARTVAAPSKPSEKPGN